MQHLLHSNPILEKLKTWRHVFPFSEVHLSTSQKVVLWSIGVVGTSAVVVGVLSRYLARKRAKPIMNPRIQRAINKRISRMRSPSGGMGSVASSGGRSSPLGFSERLSLASGSIGSGGGDAAPLSPQQLGVMESSSPTPPKWAMEFEERRIIAEEKIANALSSIADTMKSQEERSLMIEERRCMIEERITDAFVTIAESTQDISKRIDEAVQQLIQLQSLETNSFI